jgi:hypothetical protein
MLEQVSDDLAVYGRKIYSQGDEDGVIAEIFRRVGTTSKIFIEFGAEGGWENNTRLLLEEGWRGLWIEANPDYASLIRRAFRRPLRAGRLTVTEAFVTAENINQVILSSGLPTEIDFLSIDIDGNDYHIFKAITEVRPRVVCIECSVTKPPPVDWVMPYNPSHRWDGNNDCAASLVAMDRLARSKGYALVGTTPHSVNAFFVRTDLTARRFTAPFTAERFFRPVKYEDIVSYPRTIPPVSSRLGFRMRLHALRSWLRLRTRAKALVSWAAMLPGRRKW